MGSSSTPTVVADAEKLAADVKAAEQTAAPEVEKDAAEVKKDVVDAVNEVETAGKPAVEDLHKLLDDTKAATNQSQVHELVDKIRAWIKENLG